MKDKEKQINQRKKDRDSGIMQRQELHRLRRQNQLYNYKREQAIKNDYKSQLMDKLKEKAKQADQAKQRSKTVAGHSMLNMTMN